MSTLTAEPDEDELCDAGHEVTDRMLRITHHRCDEDPEHPGPHRCSCGIEWETP